MQLHCKTEKPVFRSWCFGITKAVPIAALSLGALFASAPSNAQTLGGVPYVNSWVGNDYGLPDDHIPHDFDNIYVTPSGKVVTVTSWEEGGTNAAVYSATGSKIGIIQDGTGSWGRNGGSAIFADDSYVYHPMTQNGSASTDPNGILYPPNNTTQWSCIRRYNPNGTPAPFTGGKGYDGSMLLVNSGGTSEASPTGVAVLNNELYVSDPNAGQIKVYNASTMSATPVRSFSIANVGLLDYDRLGFVWMLDTVQKKLIRFSSTGAIQSQSITFPSNVVPTSFCIDKTNDRILVTNNGNDQNVLIYTNIFSTPSQTSTFGNTGGINSGTAGVIAPLKFSEPRGVGVDSSGNIFVANNGITSGGAGTSQGGGRLEKYNSAGALQWRLNGLIFTANGDLNSANESEFYTHEFKFNLNLGNTTPGSEWSLAAQTVNKVKYPNDLRIPIAGAKNAFWTTTYMRNVSGRKLMFISDMYGYALGIYRFNAATDGETAIPSGLFSASEPTESIWRDANGNGNKDSGETESKTADNSYSMHMFPDANGGVWKANRDSAIKIRYFPMQGFDGNGNPQYSYASSIGYTPTEIADVKRLEYDAANDVLYAAGRSSSSITDLWENGGDRLTRYNNFTGARTTAWSIALPFSTTSPAKDLNMKAFCEAGDYLFLIAYRDGRIYVHKKSDGSKVGEILPTSATGSTSGWADINGGVRATKRSNGEYLIFAEENGKGKVMMYRWNPAPIATSTIRARFYPRAVAEGPGRMVGGKFQGSADNSSWTDLATISSTPAASTWTDLALSSVNYRYLRYLAPTNGYGNVAEVEFYNGTTKKTGTVFGTSGSWSGTGSDTFDKAMDGNTATFYDAASASGAYVGIDTGNTTPTPTNLIVNPSFDDDNVWTQTPTGWSEWEADANWNQIPATSSYVESYGGSNSGTRHGTHYKDAPYRVYTYQYFTGLTNGLYTLKAYARRSGNQTNCYLEAKDFGGTAKSVNIPASSSYQLIEVKDINVTNGQCTVGFWTVGGTWDWSYFDDVSFFKQ